MTVWMVFIEEGEDEGDPAEFVPQLQKGPDLLAKAGDLVSWSNRTDDVHEPWPTDSNYVPYTEAQVGPPGSPNYLSDEINPNRSSRPSWVVTQKAIDGGTTVYYCCKLHPEMRGKVIITP